MKRLIAALASVACMQAGAVSLEEEMESLVADAAADLRAHEASLALLATEEGWRAAFADFNAKRDAQQAQLVDLYQRMKARVTFEQWEAQPKALAADDEAIQELLGFLQTYDAGPGDIQPVLKQLRARAAAGQEAAIRSRFQR
jgi:hypothetical protein